MRVVFSEDAVLDVVRLRAFLEAKAPGAAKRAVSAILKGCVSLSTLSERGALREDGSRQLIVPFGSSAYVVRYRVNPDAGEVVIVRVRHGKETQ